ncbi:MAG: glycosyltransferase family 39 protein [Candidatus Omnitrophica bacterium]|nr:glycosyltransferase family 39 protein [Candidatus Omnitrophota bacterium]
MILKVMTSFLLPIVITFMIIKVVWPQKKTGFFDNLFLISLSSGIGLGASSVIFFVWLVLFSKPGEFFAVFEGTIFLIALILFCKKGRAVKERLQKTGHFSLFSAGFVVCTVSALFMLVVSSLISPHGDWDAWAIWNMRARFIFRSGAEWANAFSPVLGWSHPDYPLLIPATIARCWTYAGIDTVIVPILVSVTFTIATLLLLASYFAITGSEKKGCLASLVLLGTPLFLVSGTAQYADIPVGFFILASIAVFYLYEKSENKNAVFLVIAGFLAGLACWAKNEGLLFLAALIMGRFIAVSMAGRFRSYFKEVAVFLTGLAPVLFPLAYFKIRFAPPTDIFEKHTILTASEAWPVAVEFAKGILNFGQWPVSATIVLVICAAILGVKPDHRVKVSAQSSTLTLVFILLGFFIIYMVTPYDKNWHIVVKEAGNAVRRKM